MGPPGKESTETTHFSTWDQWGNVVSNTYTLNFSYGSGISVTGAGFLLNNEMDDFSAKPGSPNGYGLVGGIANSIEPGKRPLSSMTPTIVFDAGANPFWLLAARVAAPLLLLSMQMLLNVIEFDMGVAEATAAPRIHHQWLPDMVFYESGISGRYPKSAEARWVTESMIRRADWVRPRVSSARLALGCLGPADYRREGSGAIPQAQQ